MRDYEYEVKDRLGGYICQGKCVVCKGLSRGGAEMRRKAPRPSASPRETVPPKRLHVCFGLIRRSDPAELIERFGEEGEELLQAFEILDHAGRLKIELVDTLGEPRPEPAAGVSDLEVDL